MSYEFNGNPTHSLGVEIELQLVDRETGELRNCIDEILRQVPPELEQIVRRIFDDHTERAWQEIKLAIQQHLNK